MLAARRDEVWIATRAQIAAAFAARVPQNRPEPR